jgi:uncharacterized DUF497 family protein
VEFEWDPEKERANLVRHGITFAEAATVLRDPLELTVPDPDHSMHEDRYVSIGTATTGRILVVGYTERRGKIRLIFARRATRRERHVYQED